MAAELGFRATLNPSYEDDLPKVTAAVKAEGFGVLTEIDAQARLKQKLNADFRRYTKEASRLANCLGAPKVPDRRSPLAPGYRR